MTVIPSLALPLANETNRRGHWTLRLASATFALCLAAGAAQAQSDDALIAANRLVAAMHMRQTAERQLADSKTTFPEVFAKAGIKDPKLVTEYTDEVIGQLEVGLGDRLAAAAKAYATHDTAADLNALAAFYETPAGQRLAANDPEIEADIAELGNKQLADALGTFVTAHAPSAETTK